MALVITKCCDTKKPKTAISKGKWRKPLFCEHAAGKKCQRNSGDLGVMQTYIQVSDSKLPKQIPHISHYILHAISVQSAEKQSSKTKLEKFVKRLTFHDFLIVSAPKKSHNKTLNCVKEDK